MDGDNQKEGTKGLFSEALRLGADSGAETRLKSVCTVCTIPPERACTERKTKTKINDRKEQNSQHTRTKSLTEINALQYLSPGNIHSTCHDAIPNS
jgi:hypothetical protein